MTPERTAVPRIPAFALLLVGLAIGALTFALVRSEPGYALVDDSLALALAELGAGCALITVGTVSWLKRPESPFGALLAVAGIGWFLAEWNSPEVGFSLGFTIGVALYVVAPALIAHAALSYPDGHLSSGIDRLGVAFAYLGALGLLGVLPALFFDPDAAGCAQCPGNLLLVHGSVGRFDDLNQVGIDLGLGWSVAVAALLMLRFVRSTEALRKLAWPVLVAGTAYMLAVAADFAHSLDRGFLSNDATEVDLRLVQAGSLVALSLGVAWGWLRARKTRSEVARLVLELAHSPPPGGLRDALAEMLGDPTLELAYLLADGNLVDHSGRAVSLRGDVTPLVRDGREVALLGHRPGLLDDPGLAQEVAAAARLGLDNERLRAEARAQLADLRASRARVIATGDAERQRLERDLHDGAQQQLVGLALSLRVARSGLGPDADRALLERIDEAGGELRIALAELRELANGIFPVVLADEGLAAALEAMSETAAIPIEIAQVLDRRFDAPVEVAAYFAVSEALRRGAASGLTVRSAVRDGRLVVEVDGDGLPERLPEVEDRVGALDGSIEHVRGPGGRATVMVEIPCES
jgi:signal transduction histidine kinase